MNFKLLNRSALVLLSLVLLKSTGFAQSTLCTIEGRVIDKSSGEPLELVNVYLSETTFGSATNSKGQFEIKNVPQSLYQVIVSSIGFEPQIVKVDLINATSKRIDIALVPKLIQLEEISVKGKTESNWKNQLARFKELFFGKNDYARDCTILNEIIINFKEDSEKLTAEAADPLIIINNALGYKIETLLKDFEYNKKSKNVSFSIYPRFTEIDTLVDIIENEFKTNRRNAYLGSTMQLFALLAKGKYDFVEAGYKIYVSGSRDQVFNSEEFVSYNERIERYLLKNSIAIVYWKDGIVKKSYLNLTNRKGLEFDSFGYLLSKDYVIWGDLSGEGVALMLPRNFSIESN